MLDHYLHTAYAAARLLDPQADPITLTPPHPGNTPENLPDPEQALDWLTSELAVLLAAVDLAGTGAWNAHAWQLAWTMATYLYRRGHWHDLATTQRAAIAAAHQLTDLRAEARAHRNLSGAYIRLGRTDDAHTELRRALELYRRAGDRVGLADTHYNLAHVWEQDGRYQEALDHARQALDLYEAAGHRSRQADALNTVGWKHALLGHQEHPAGVVAIGDPTGDFDLGAR